MSLLLNAQQLSKAYGSQTLFRQISFSLFRGDRLGLIGPNGSGKTSLLNILAGQEAPDQGGLTWRQGVRVSYASQQPHFPEGSVMELLLGAHDKEREVEVKILLDKMGFGNLQQPASQLSGGWKKRLDIARALLEKPDLLLLDEPTNHLDLEGIWWLEQFLRKERLTYLVVSHDRYFLENIADKILELNPQLPEGLLLGEGPLSHFMQRREQLLEEEEQRRRGLASQVRQEKSWLNTSPKARTCKAASRVKKAHELIDALSSLEKRQNKAEVQLAFTSSERETRKLLTAHNLTKFAGERALFEGIQLTLTPGMKLGVLGKNGSGKTTLLKLLAGEVSADKGTLKYAEGLKIVYFDQQREKVDPEVTLKEALAQGRDYVTYLNQQIHVHGWAKRFLFAPEKLRLQVKYLSGGERARLLMARLMLQPADLLFLDEPTNDLDIATLEVMERSLLEFPGALLLITHDRSLMEGVCTHFLGLGEGVEGEFFSEYRQWERRCQQKSCKEGEEAKKREGVTCTAAKEISMTPFISSETKGPQKRRLSYKEQQEWEGIEEKIQQSEQKLGQLQAELERDFSPSLCQQLADLEAEITHLYARWEYLYSLQKGL